MKWSEQMRELESSDEYFKKCVIEEDMDRHIAKLLFNGKIIAESEIISGFAAPDTEFRIEFGIKDNVFIDEVFLSNIFFNYFFEDKSLYFKPTAVSSFKTPENIAGFAQFKVGLEEEITYYVLFYLL